jgi:hypothetical protein
MSKKTLNFYEAATNVRLKKVCQQYGASVYPKVRLADIFPVEGSGIPHDQMRFALQAHFDFLVTDQHRSPLFAVEFNDPHHFSEDQAGPDAVKDKLCGMFNLPMLWINSRYLVPRYRGMDLLSWFIEVWFLQDAFARRQAEGRIPADAVFSPFLTLAEDTGAAGVQNKRERHPFWLSAPLLANIRSLAESGRCLDDVPSHIIGVDDRSRYHAISWLRISEARGLVAQTAVHSEHFRISLRDVLEELVIYDLHEELVRVLRGRASAQSLDGIRARVDAFQSVYETESIIISGDYIRVRLPATDR